MARWYAFSVIAFTPRADPSPLPKPRRLRIWPALLLLGGAMLAMLTVAWHAHSMGGELNAATDRRAQARTGLLQVEHLLSLFKDIESGSRGFAISGRNDYLDPYREALAELPATRRELRETLGDPAPGGTPWATIDALLERRLAAAGRVIEQRRLHGEHVLHDVGLFADGKAAMDKLREQLDRISDLQRARIAEINAEVGLLRKQSALWLALATGLSLLLAGVGAWLLAVERRRRLRLEQRLREHGEQLAQAVAERTRELAEAHTRLANFARGEERAVEAERRRLAREVHDQIGQVFTAIRLIVGSLPREAFPPGQDAALAQALDLGIASTRRVTAELRPPLLDDLGLAAALTHHAAATTTQSRVACQATLADESALTAEQALSLFRIVQEAVTNALRHAGASRIEITGRVAGAEYLLDIKDDGGGLGDNPPRPGALGLTGMHERAALLGGRCAVATDPDGGTRVAVRLPLTKEAQ